MKQAPRVHENVITHWELQRDRDCVVGRVVNHVEATGEHFFEVRLSFNGSRFYSCRFSSIREAMREAGELLEDRTARGWVIIPDEQKATH